MPDKKPLQLRLAVVLASVETLATAGVTIFFAVGLITGKTENLVALIALVLMMVGATSFMASATVALSKLKRWGRSAIIFWQFLQVSLGWGSLGGKNEIIPLAIGIFAISGLTALLLFSKKLNPLFLDN